MQILWEQGEIRGHSLLQFWWEWVFLGDFAVQNEPPPAI